MIKTKELMLGNWVLAGKNAKFPMQVVSIFEDEVYLDFGGNEGDCFEEKEEDMFPVPLVKEILLKNGFVKKRDKNSEYYKSHDGKVFICFKNGINIFIVSSPISSTTRVVANKIINYVHELQNILTLAGVEMEFKI